MKSTNILPEAGNILISEPSLQDFYFERSVVLLAEHNAEGSFGLVLNKPVDIKFNDIVKDFPPFDGKIFLGGPVSTKNLFFVHTKGDLIEHSQSLGQNLFWGGNIEDVKILLDSKLLNEDSIRFFVGYAGWSENQLNEELKTDSWLVSKTDLNKLFASNPTKMWANAIKDLGSEYALWANFPKDPGLN